MQRNDKMFLSYLENGFPTVPLSAENISISPAHRHLVGFEVRVEGLAAAWGDSSVSFYAQIGL